MSDFPSQESLEIRPATLKSGGRLSDEDIATVSLNFAHDLVRDFEDRDKIFKNIDDVIFLNQAVKIPENYKATAIEVRSPMPNHIAGSITAALSINTPTITYQPTGFGDLGEDVAAFRREFFTQAWIKQQREKQRRLHRAWMYSLVTKGVAVFKTHDRKIRAWAKYSDYAKNTLRELDEQRKRKEIDDDSYYRIFDGRTENYKRGLPYPIETQDIPPETFYYQKGEDGFVRVVEVKEVPYFDTLLKYGGAMNSRGKVVAFDDVTSAPLPAAQWHNTFPKTGPGCRRTLLMIEVWDKDECVVLLRGPGDLPSKGAGFVGSGLMVRRFKHNYGNPHLGTLNGPYFMSSGIMTASRDPAKANLSVLFAYLHLFPLLNALLTMQSQAAFSFSYPAYRRTSPSTFSMAETPFGYDAKEIHANRQQLVPGAIFPHDIQAMDPPRTSVDLDKAIQFVRGLIERVLPDAVQGVITGETAGYALNQATHLATLAWSPIIQNAEDCLSARVGFESWLIENNIGETVYVNGALPKMRGRIPTPVGVYKEGWLGLGPKQLTGGSHLYEVALKPVNINNDTLELRNIKEELDMRIMDPYEAMRKRGRNPVDVERSWLLYSLKQDPAIQDQMKQRVFAGLATIDQDKLRSIPAEEIPGGPPAENPSGVVPLTQPGIPQGLPTTGFVPPFQGGEQAGMAQPPMTAPQMPPGTPGTPPGAPGGVRGAPSTHQPIPGA